MVARADELAVRDAELCNQFNPVAKFAALFAQEIPIAAYILSALFN